MTSQEAAGAAPATVRLRLDLSYDGTGFSGWAIQPGLRTVQGELEHGLATVLRTAARGIAPPRVTVAGRTDTGVHARGQVAHVDVDLEGWTTIAGRSRRTEGEALLRRLAGVVGRDLVVRRAVLAPEGFNARFSALGRRYVYRVSDDASTRDPLRRSHVLWHSQPLDGDAMAEAARAMPGLHDFAAYCKPRDRATTVRSLETYSWARVTEGTDAGLLVATVQADAFCHNMVRALVGVSLGVGEGRHAVSWPAELLAGRVRDSRSAIAAARGLTLEEVRYPLDHELGPRAELTRARRVPHGSAAAAPERASQCVEG